MSSQLVMAKKSSRRLTMAKVARGVVIFVLGCVVFATKHALQNAALSSSQEATPMVHRRSAEVMYNSMEQKQPKEPVNGPVAQQLKRDDFSLVKRYIIEANPAAYVNKQNPKVKSEFESRLKKRNVTRWQYPDFVHVPLTELGVVFLNGQRFYQQGVTTPPEYRVNATGADTRAVSDHKCPGRNGGGNGQQKTPQLQMRSLVEKPAQPAQQVGCCNGQPYNTNKRCCCRRASFDKDTKFCCAVDGCRNFQIFKRNDPNAVAKCHALEGVVVQEYGYH